MRTRVAGTLFVLVTGIVGMTQSGAASETLVGVFEGRTPCGALATEFTGFPALNCEKIKWRLTLYRDAATGRPGTYVYEGTRTRREGQWTSEPRPQRGGTVYRLEYGSPARVLSLLSVDDGVLLLLDADLKVLPGDASWSYALNRTQARPGTRATTR